MSCLKSGAFPLLYFFLLLSFAGRAQPALPQFNPYTGAGVESGLRSLSMPFAGGITTAQFAMADLNRDGTEDLVLFVPAAANQSVRTFLNKGTAGSPKWEYAPRFAVAFPANLRSFLKLIDYNCDGIPDLFHNGSGALPGEARVNVSRGYYNSSNELRFTFYKDLYYPLSNGTTNVSVNNEDEPGIADVDGDGDIDLISYSTEGGRMYYYRNYRAERGLPCDSIQIELQTRCWGLVGQGTQRRFQRKRSTVDCIDDATPVPAFLVPPLPAGSASKTLHGNNTVCLLDIDGDGDLDVLNSNRDFSDMQLQVNGKAGSGSTLDSIVSQDTLWQRGGKKVLLPLFPTAHHLDLDGDGQRDIVIAPRASGAGAPDANPVWYYRNTGTATAPNFVFQKDTLLVEDMIDGGSDSHPLFYDFNKDGKPDILMGSTLSQFGVGVQNRLYLYENISTGVVPQYRFVTNNGANVAGLGQIGCVPAIGDLDGDGKDDLLIGLQNGQFAFYRNEALSDTARPVWQLKQNPLKNPDGTPLQVDANAAPFIYDINSDGLPDILAGSRAGRLTAFVNTNTAQGVPRFGVRKDSLGGPGVVADPANGPSFRYSAPYVGRIDSLGEVYLVMGSNSGYLYAWRGVGSGNMNATYTLASSDFSGIRMPRFSAPAFGDMDGDGKPEMLAGNAWGGLFLYKSNGVVGVHSVSANPSVALVALFPNPAAAYFTLQREGGIAGPLHYRLFALTGAEMQSGTVPAGSMQVRVETGSLPAGLYFLQVRSGGNTQTLKVSVVHP